jgi:hypothetical protein
MSKRSKASTRELVVGFVCEGSTDVVVLRRFVEAVLGGEIDARTLQPETDELDRQLVGGRAGWSEVRAWCERLNSFDEYFDPDIGDPIDVLVIALDLDIAIRAGITKRPENLSAYDAAQLCKVVKGWLPGKIPGRVVIAIHVMSIEAWVLAALFPRMKQLEAIADPAAILVERRKIEMGRNGPWKRVAEYRGFAESVARRAKHVRDVCGEADRFAIKLEALGV